MPRIMKIDPHQGIGPIKFNMTSAQVQAAMGRQAKPFKHPFAEREADCFDEIAVMYDVYGRCNAIGVGRGGSTELEYDGYLLFAHSAREVREWAKTRDPQLDPKDGFTSKVLGLNMGADWVDETEGSDLDDPAMAFVVFRPGYYEERARMRN